MEDTTPAGRPIVDREKTAPFLIRAFIKVGGFHRLTQFEDGPLPTADEQQIFTWRDATLREVLTTLRSTAPPSTEYRHPLARYSFRAVYADSKNRGRAAQKDLGTVYSRDILGEPGTLASPAPRLLADVEAAPSSADDERTLEELRLVPGDYLCVMVQLPKNVPLAPGASTQAGELTIKGSGAASAAVSTTVVGGGWKKEAGRGDGGWGSTLGIGTAPAAGRGGGHWRGASDAPTPASRGRGGRGNPRVPPPRRESPPRRSGWGDRGGRRRSQSLSRSRSPPRRRGSRYD
ncbi:Sin3 associated polypeptide p18-domain-containing protein [Irpex rosettiformis]|uniref:Sin3 associated polypeptide p18-domain-containing protein n=1 Tax=Irpex rosettiformis TaxID=378272 RepID=A0ACB8UDJ7_9APHY|nr:Sin3 associated polypeptide p18-domain-containing protein [Irpex rosettiformis]